MAPARVDLAPPNVAELEAAGFSDEQIRRLLAVRAGYNPFAEFVETNGEWVRLQFFKWLYEHGYYARD
jgi:hypothetical protein